MTTTEEWRAIPGFEGFYDVSEGGRVRSVRRSNVDLKPARDKDGYLRYVLCVNTVKTFISAHRAVALAFIGPPTNEKPWVLHSDDDSGNNHVSNLRWGSPKENSRDAVRNGRNWEANKTTCLQGHPKSQFTGTPRQCRACDSDRHRIRRSRGLTDDNDPRHGTLNGYNGYSCRCNPCKKAWQEYSARRRLEKKGSDL